MALFSLCRALAGRVLWPCAGSPNLRCVQTNMLLLSCSPFLGALDTDINSLFPALTLCYIFLGFLLKERAWPAAKGEKTKICFDFPPRVCTENDNVTFV
jgi:hypothetical protein